MNTTATTVIRWTGLAALAGGLIFAGIQPIHPADALSSVTTDAWAVITPLKTVMCLLLLIGVTSLYARQVNNAGRLGFAGYVLFNLSWAVNLVFIFAEAFILPLLATTDPEFVSGFLGLASGQPSDVNLGVLAPLFMLNGLFYMIGGLLFGVATFRAGILPRAAAALLAVTAVLTPFAALLPHEIQRLAGMPVGLAVAWLGYALWAERRAATAERAADINSRQLRQSSAQ